VPGRYRPLPACLLPVTLNGSSLAYASSFSSGFWRPLAEAADVAMLMRTVEEQWVESLPFDWQRDVMDKRVRDCAREHDVVEDEVERL